MGPLTQGVWGEADFPPGGHRARTRRIRAFEPAIGAKPLRNAVPPAGANTFKDLGGTASLREAGLEHEEDVRSG